MRRDAVPLKRVPAEPPPQREVRSDAEAGQPAQIGVKQLKLSHPPSTGRTVPERGLGALPEMARSSEEISTKGVHTRQTTSARDWRSRTAKNRRTVRQPITAAEVQESAPKSLRLLRTLLGEQPVEPEQGMTPDGGKPITGEDAGKNLRSYTPLEGNQQPSVTRQDEGPDPNRRPDTGACAVPPIGGAHLGENSGKTPPGPSTVVLPGQLTQTPRAPGNPTPGAEHPEVGEQPLSGL